MSGHTVRYIALVVVMAAVTYALTRVAPVPVPATGGYVHLGDIASNFAALAFGPWAGALIVGGGMAIADLTGPWAIYAPGSFVIHGLQVIIVALVGRNRKPWLMFLGAVAGSIVVIGGYFTYQAWILGEGTLTASAELLPNVVQTAVGLIGVPVYLLVVRAYPPLVRWTQRS